MNETIKQQWVQIIFPDQPCSRNIIFFQILQKVKDLQGDDSFRGYNTVQITQVL